MVKVLPTFCSLLICTIGAIYAIEDTVFKLIGGNIAGVEKLDKNRKSVVGTKEFPYMASLEYYRGHVCGAVIIDLVTVLTAAHCVAERDIEWLTVRGGTFTIQDKLGDNVQSIQVKFFKLHGTYNKYGRKENDIALLRLEKHFTQNEYVAPINLPRKMQENTFSGEEAIFIGYGQKESGYLSSTLLKASFRIMTNEQCNAVASTTNNIMCGTGKFGKEAACPGDSGGPLVKHNPNNPKYDMLLGLGSFIVLSTEKKEDRRVYCNAKNPTFFADIASLRNWIDRARKCTSARCKV